MRHLAAEKSMTRSGARVWCKRIGWLVAIWMLSVAALGIVALALKGIMRLAGLSA